MGYCMPPDPNPRMPSFTPLPNSCDTHLHVFGPPERFPFASTRAYTPPAAPLEHYLNMSEVIWGSDWPQSNIFVPGKTPNDGDLLDLLLEFAPDEKIRRKILVDNPAVLYDFENSQAKGVLRC